MKAIPLKENLMFKLHSIPIVIVVAFGTLMALGLHELYGTVIHALQFA